MQKIIYIAWAQAIVAALGSLYFSEFLDLPPCSLCWYQRILVYALVFIIAGYLLWRNSRLLWSAIALGGAGFILAGYHTLLTYGWISKNSVLCLTETSCSTIQIEWLGFITIPLLSLVAFAVITASLLFSHSRSGNTF